jgi:plastocyanin
MNKVIWIVVVILVVVIGGYYLIRQVSDYGATNQNSSATANQNNNSNESTSSVGPVTVPTASKSDVVISGFAFSPQVLTIKAGTDVIWTNNDSVGHTVKFDAFASPLINQGETFEHQFMATGTYNYICSVHPTMTGTIIVQ